MKTPNSAYGASRERGPSLSYSEIERAARSVMATGNRPSARAVYEALGRRGSPNHINASLERFWRDQAAMADGDPLALSRLPPELADAAVAQWEQALRLAQQKRFAHDTAAQAHLEQLRRDTDARARSIELREKEWDMAARVRERALADARDHINLLMKELSTHRAELQARDARIVDLESQVESHRQQLAAVITRAIAKNRAAQQPKQKTKQARTKSTAKPSHAKPRKPFPLRAAQKITKNKRSKR